MAPSTGHPVQQLAEEQKMLSSLMYRNKNQHSRTVVFKHLDRVVSFLKRIPLDFLMDLITHCETMTASLQQFDHKNDQRSSGSKASLSRETIAKLSVLCYDLKTVLLACSETAKWCLLTSERIRVKLKSLLFVPLYTVLLCCVSVCPFSFF